MYHLGAFLKDKVPREVLNNLFVFLSDFNVQDNAD